MANTTTKRKSSKRISKRQQRQAERAKTARMNQIRIGGIILLAAVIIGGLIFWRNASVAPVDNITEIMPANIDGPADAPVKIVEFGDLGCPACRAWHNAGIKAQLKEKYGDQISFTFRHFPVITPLSPKAAEAAQCAAEQGAFWAYHDYIYENVPANALTVPELKSYAGVLGLDQAQFDACLDSGKYREYVARDRQAAFDAGARGTPSFFINGKAVYYPGFEELSGIIDQELGN
ncbi:MAG: hypothetical protein D6706_01210 [Chloroflexi bacterium]|nr:MAG: hypothetical protein D6706_01210 [Chloroflexota bacterium]